MATEEKWMFCQRKTKTSPAPECGYMSGGLLQEYGRVASEGLLLRTITTPTTLKMNSLQFAEVGVPVLQARA